MRAHLLISILVWGAVFGFTRVVSNDLSDSQKTELAIKLNMLVHHSGWRSMDVQIKFYDGYQQGVTNPICTILEAMSSNPNSIDISNVEEKYWNIWLVLSCKYAEIIYNFQTLIEHFINACKDEDRESGFGLKRFGDCFDLVLIKLDSASSRFKSMREALDLLYSIGHQSQPLHDVMVATQQLTDFTKTIRPNMWFKWGTSGFSDDGIDDELTSINNYIFFVFKKYINRFLITRCVTPSNRQLPAPTFEEEFLEKISNLGDGMTKLEYIGNQIDRLVDAMSSSWFRDLGLAYDGTENIMISGS